MIKKLIAVTVLLLTAPWAKGQFPNTYRAINSYGYNPNVGTIDPAVGKTPGTVTITIAFSGSITGPQQMNNSGIKHTPYAYATLNNHTQSAVGPQFAPVANMAWSQTFEFDLFSDGCTWDMLNSGSCIMTTQPEIQCPIYGMIHIPWVDIQFETAITYSTISVLLNSNGWHPQAPYCYTPSMPPDLAPATQAQASVKPGQYVESAFMWRETQHGSSFLFMPWHRALPIDPETWMPPTFDAPICTNYDAGFRDLSWPL